MYFQQIITPGLGCLSYILGCPGAGVMAVVDPKRDIDDYLKVAKEQGMRITHVFDTHVHADHISGAQELRRATGADIYIHESAPVNYEVIKIAHNDQFRLGNAHLRVLHTPGHTPNSISLLVTDQARSNAPQMILTGDLLFVGDTGRPDLPGEEILNEQIRNLFDSLHKTLGELPDYLEVYPAHGQGSLCGRGMSAKPSSTLGYERIANPRLQLKEFTAFSKDIMSHLPLRPQSFSHIIATNMNGAPLLDLCNLSDWSLGPAEVDKLRAEGAVVLDMRNPLCFATAHIPGSINVDAEQAQAVNWVGTAIAPGSKLVLVLHNKEEFPARLMELRRIGYDDVCGYLEGGLQQWIAAGKDIGSTVHISACTLEQRLKDPKPFMIVDVRTPREYEEFHLPNSVHMPFDKLLSDSACYTDPEMERIVVCQTGYRASIAASLLLARGCKNVRILAGGMELVKKCLPGQ